MNYFKQFGKKLAAAVVAGAFLFTFAGTGVTVSATGHRAEQSTGQAVKMPQTAEEHLALAESYRKKAAEYRAEVEFHQTMLANYKKQVPKTKETIENSYVKKMRLHCEKFIKAGEALAREANQMAEFHTLRAKELQGK